MDHPPLPGPGGLTPEVALWLLGARERTAPETAGFLLELCRAHPRASRALGTALLAHLERTGLLDAAAFQGALAGQRAALEQTPLGTLVLAQCAERRGDLEEAVSRLRALDDPALPAQDSVILDLARVLARAGAGPEACAALRMAAGRSRDFGFLSRAAKQLARLKDLPRSCCARTLRVALLHPTTTDLWVPLLRLGLFREGIWAELMVPPYGTHEQAVLDPASPLYAFDPELVILADSWRELDLPAFSPDPARLAAQRVEHLAGRWRQLRERIPARIIQHDFEVPAVDANGYLGQVMPGGRAAVIRRINDLLLAEARAHQVTLLNLDHLAGAFGKRAWDDPATWFTAKQYPAPAALPALVDGQVARIRAGLGLARKVLVLDLDNTLWGGVIGEDGLKGIQIGPPSAAGEAHLALQRYAAQLKERGILLAVCSKNNEQDARAPFLEHEGMLLRLEDFVAFTANWQDKPGNLRALASTLSLGLDSFVFMDDNPAERALVRQELPEVAVPELSDPARFVEVLDAGGYFEADWLSPEDLARSGDYLKNGQREALRTSSGSLEAFLQGLDMTCEHGPVNDHVLPRVVQLLGKTNQFNLTTRRHGEAQIRAFLADPRAWTQYFRLKDRFADNGLVGVVIALPSAADPKAWEVDTWLMSCRVIGRQLENFMFNTLLVAARERGIQAVCGLYLPTAKNGMVADLYPQLGFTEAGEEAGEGRRFRIDPALAPAHPADFISPA
jgi:FkbH-like protein